MPREGGKPRENGWYSRRQKTGEKAAEHRAKMQRKEALYLEGIRVRAEERAARSPQQQLAVLDKRLGAGQGAKKERERLKAQIEEARVSKAKAEHQKSKPKKPKKDKGTRGKGKKAKKG